MKIILKKFFKILLLILIIFILLLFSLLILTQTALFRSFVSNKITSIANDILIPELRIGKLEGNFFTNLSFHEIALISQGDEILYIDELILKYDLRSIHKKRIGISRINIRSPRIYLIEKEGRWNFDEIFIAEEKVDKAEKETEGAFDWHIVLDRLILDNANIYLSGDMENDQIPDHIEDLFLELKIILHQNTIKAQIKDMASVINWNEYHRIHIEDINTDITLIDDTVNIIGFNLKSSNTAIEIMGNIDLSPFKVNAETDIILSSFQDLSYFVPEINPQQSMKLFGNISYTHNDLNALIQIIDDHGGLDIIFKMAESKNENMGFSDFESNLKFKGFQPHNYLKAEIPEVTLNGIMDLRGNGFDYKEDIMELSIELKETRVLLEEFISGPLAIRSLDLKASIEQNSLQTSLALNIEDIGNIDSVLFLNDIDSQLGIDLDASIRALNLSKLLNDDVYNSDLNFDINASMPGLNTFPADIKLLFKRSQISDHNIDELSFAASILDENSMYIKGLNIEILDNILKIKGLISNTRESDLEYSLNINNIRDLLEPYTEIADDLFLYGSIEGSLKGIPDNMTINAFLDINDILYQDISCDIIKGQVSAVIMKELPITIETDLEAYSLIVSENRIEKIAFLGDLSETGGSQDIEIIYDDDYQLEAGIKFLIDDDIFSLALSKLHLTAKKDKWSLDSDDAFFVYDQSSDSLSVKDFILSSGEQKVTIEGIVSLSDENDLKIAISKFDIIPFLEMMEEDTLKRGLLDLDLRLKGLPAGPEIISYFTLENIMINDLEDILIKGEFSYDPQEQLSNARLDTFHKSLPLADATLVLPMLISAEEFILYDDRYSSLTISTEEIKMDIFGGFIEGIENITGTFFADIILEDLLTDIKFSGMSRISNGGFAVPELGTSYRDLRLQVQLSDNKISLSELYLRSSRGTLDGSGYFKMGDKAELGLSDISLRMNMSSFPLVSISAMEIIADSRLDLHGSLNEPVFGGFVNISRGRIDLDQLLGVGADESSDPPLLVRARVKEEEIGEEIIKVQEPLFDLGNLRGKLNIRFDRNFWIRSSDMNIEMKADLDIIKRGIDFEIFGVINTVRGYYVFLNKRFQIEQGEILFSGGSDINPDLSISTIYTFRGIDRNRRDLRLIISGNLENIDIAFELDDQEIEETDAISYLLFGRSFDELSQGERSQATSHAHLIGGILANKITEQLTTVLGDTFQLDHFEFHSDTASSQVGLEIGKYLTDDIFLSYKKDFDIGGSQEQVYEEILVEYQITRYLFLQAVKSSSKTSGVDLIWRFQWK